MRMPTYEQLLDAFQMLEEGRDEWHATVKELGAEITKLTEQNDLFRRALQSSRLIVLDYNHLAQELAAAQLAVIDQRDTALVAIQAVWDLHSPKKGWERGWRDPAEALAKGWPVCEGCRTIASSLYLSQCPTRKILAPVMDRLTDHLSTTEKDS